jgi:hypothetical protein
VSSKAAQSYTALDRMLHKLAFGSGALQGVLADLEQSMFEKQWRGIGVAGPIFLSSLPRAGTSVLLQALARAGSVATHTYRDMPFVLTPVLWQRASRAFRRTSGLEERAHGDGLAINEDSPEAFEEVLWLRHFPGHYDDDGIACWEDDAGQVKFERAFAEHMRKVIFLRRNGGGKAPRYVSKNNANIARIGYLRTLFPDAAFAVPLRHPLEQAVSLLRQHLNFTRQHAGDAFTRRYMADIGHFEFGALHRPIRFAGFSELTGGMTPESVDYWLAYWIAAFQAINRYPGLCLVSFEGICSDPAPGLRNLLDCLGLETAGDGFPHAVQLFRAPPVPRRDGYRFDATLEARAMGLYHSLLERCVA